MSRREPPTKAAFEKLLAWLDPDRERAGGIYHRIQTRLIKIFALKGYHDAEDLADETINVVASKIDQLIANNYVGDPALYFYGVAKQIHRDRMKIHPRPSIPSPPPDPLIVEEVAYCLDQCLDALPLRERELIVAYHQEEKQAKIQKRKELAEKLGISRNALRIQMHHKHTRLRECIEKCLSVLRARK
jgi:RNA polymerase sigma factor (sigma-70 family)